jgi:hypothetical protein
MTPRHNILSSSILFCHASIIPFGSRLPVIVSKFSPDSASTSATGADAILLERSPYKASSYQIVEACKVCGAMREFRNN